MAAEGFVAPGFEKVLDTFKQNLKDGLDKGGAFSAYYKGELVVNIWGGLADPEKKTPWKKDTLGVFWSTTKAVSAIVVAHLVDRGLLSYSDKISKHWPEFAQKGKENATVSNLMTHSTGLVQLDGKWELKEYVDNYPKFEARLAEQEPYWKPGSKCGYHALTFALYIDPIVRRVDPKKRPLAQYFEEELAKPLGLDFYIGLPKDLFDRGSKLAILEDDIDLEAAFKDMLKNANQEYLQRSNADRSPLDMTDFPGSLNTPEMRSIPCGSTHGSGTAESLAKLFGILANGGVYDGKQVLSEKVISELKTPAVTAVDQMIGAKASRGMGTMLKPIVVNDNFDKPLQMFGHPGAGGQFGYADSSTKLGVAYNSNFMTFDSKSFEDLPPRYGNLLNATYDCINALEGTAVKRKIYISLERLDKDRNAKTK